MKKAILIAILIVALTTLSGCKQAEEGPKLSADNVDIIPDISFNECLTQIKATNPAMSDQAASDNCRAIEAVNKNDKSLCDKVTSADIKSACLAQFQ